MIDMIIIWSVIIAVALLIEFLTYDLVSSWFAVGGLGSLILAICNVDVYWQLLVFVIISIVCLAFIRRLVKRFVKVRTTPTNIDSHVGARAKLLKDVSNGRSEIIINDITWTVAIEDELKAGAEIILTGLAGNKFLARDAAKANEVKIYNIHEEEEGKKKK